MRELFSRHLRYALATARTNLSPVELLLPLSLTVRDLLVDRLVQAEKHYPKTKTVNYLSMEYLLGRVVGDNLCNLGINDACRDLLAEHGVELEEVLESESDAGLGNGGLGRLAACLLESMATLGLPAVGYGIDYQYGLFKQVIDGGHQKEIPDRWRETGAHLYIDRLGEPCVIPVYGRVDHSNGAERGVWVDYQSVIGLPHDLPIAGFGGSTVNVLRLYSARSSEEINLDFFNQGDYTRALEQKIACENISRILYPSDAAHSGKQLRLLQEYFLVACSLKDIVRRYLEDHSGFNEFPACAAIQMNDTHPSLAVAELMRVLVDSHHLEWKDAWEITRASLAFTNHTLLPEALERWPISLLQHVLPRHMEIIYEINQEFLDTVQKKWPLDLDRLRRMSVIEEGGEKQVRMAHLAIIGSHSVNGVSALHSELLQTSLVPDFHELFPGRFNNKTNGISPRKWLLKANPPLADLLTESLGASWTTDLERLRALEALSGRPEFQARFLQVKRRNKERLANTILQTAGVLVDPDAMFDVQVKRIHEYKRQVLNVLRIVHDYVQLVDGGRDPQCPRTYIFAGKAAPGYWMAKQIIRLVHVVARTINSDPRTRDYIKVVFIPNYCVSLAEIIIPAADLSQQISTAGMEASGTGNMKLALNGAFTLGTLDGANIEMLRAVGEDNMYIFGLQAGEIAELRAAQAYRPMAIYEADPAVRITLDSLNSGRFGDDAGLCAEICNAVLHPMDRYFHLADFASYVAASGQAAEDFTARPEWARKAILNVARMGHFSSDRTIREYAREIWGIETEVAVS